MKSSTSASGLSGRAWVVAILVGVLTGLGSFTFGYGEGLSYLSTDPRACVNCHIMSSQYDSWQKASHHTVARCVDCHLPHQTVAKLVAKADNGYRHSKAFTLEDFGEPIQITARNARILQENCLACHQEMVSHLVDLGENEADQVSCIHCHRSVGHGETLGLGGPERAQAARASEN